MRKEIISDGQAISLMILFYLGTTITTGTSLGIGNNGWISIGLAMLEALPFLFICVRLLSAFPGKNLFDILELLLGKPSENWLLCFTPSMPCSSDPLS